MCHFRHTTAVVLFLAGCQTTNSQLPTTAWDGGPNAPLSIERDDTAKGFKGDRYTWQDESGSVRSALLIHNDAVDPAGKRGGYLREYAYQTQGTTRVCTGSSNNHPGWGYTVNHFGSSGGSASSRNVLGTYQRVFSGRHHAVHQFQWTVPINGQNVDVTVQWLFSTGRAHPLWAVTFDTSKLAPNALSADTRAPYGDIGWDGDTDSNVDGVGWGDHHKFISLASPLSLQSGWDYRATNIIPFVRAWSSSADAEMGSVQTQTWMQHDAGGYGFHSEWGKRSDTGPMPDDFNWTYQLNQYELPFTRKSKRLAWGSNFGAVGKDAYSAYGGGRTLDGHPYQSYSVFMVLGRHSEDPVLKQVTAMEAVQATTLTATLGTVATSGPAGVARTDSVTYEPAGWNPIRASWDIQADQNRATLQFHVGELPLENPMIVVRNYTRADPPTVEIDGTEMRPDVDGFLSIDTTEQELWLTLRRTLRHTSEIRIH